MAQIGFEGLVDDNEANGSVELTDEPKVAVKRVRYSSDIEDNANEMQSMVSFTRADENDTVYFKDGKRKIDFVLTYDLQVKEGENLTAEELGERQRKRANKRESFLKNLEDIGIEHEIEYPQEDSKSKTHYVKIHVTFPTLEKGAEDLLLRMPIKKVDLPRRDLPWYRDLFSKIEVRDPFTIFDPKIPPKFEYDDCFTAPFSSNSRKGYIGIGQQDKFFSNAQRIAIAYYFLEKTYYSEDDDQMGISRLLQNKSFSAAFPLHDGSYRVGKGEEIENERQLLYREWSHPRNWYKYQPLENIRHYFGEKIGLYFVWVGFYTSWLFWASIVGIIIFICGLYTAASDYNPVAKEICNESYREYFYMCPLCDTTCDFWYFRSGCVSAHFSLLFDYGGTVFFASFMALWAVLFLEFWKRTEAQLQYEWDTLGYEGAEERERPQFIQAIKTKIQNYPQEKKNQYKIRNPVFERDEYIQPQTQLMPKVCFAFSIVMTLVGGVIGVVFAVLIYRLAVAASIYRLIRTFPGGPSVADIITSVTGSMIQLIAIVVMNQIYERVATWLTKWELHRTNSEYEDSFTFKMYLFQFVNYYSSLFYIGFFKGNFTGFPGSYIRMFGSYRLDECPTYGCLFELSIQLMVIFVGKQVMNDIVELGKPYAMKLLKIFLRRKKENEKEESRWEKDLVQAPLSVHGLFFEYLELVIQYGFVTIFVTAFPLAPFFAWLNNVIEIRLDAHKFVQLLRRPVAERAQDIGAWFYLLNFTTSLCVITNAFLIAVTSNFINFEVYNRVFKNDPMTDCNFENTDLCADGYVAWSTSPFPMSDLLQPVGKSIDTRFPIYTVMSLEKYVDGKTVMKKPVIDGMERSSREPILYLPFLDFDCLKMTLSDFDYDNFTASEFEHFYKMEEFQNATLKNNGKEDSPIKSSPIGDCFNQNTTCRHRSQIDYQDGKYPLKYWRTIATKLAFVIVFEHVIFLIGIVLDLLIPDIPRSVKDEIRREKFLASKISANEKVLEEITATSSI